MAARLLDDQQRASMMDHIFRRVGKLDDASLIRLEVLTRPAETGQPITPAPAQPASDPDQVSRRYFLTALAAGGLLSAAVGGAAVLAFNDPNVRQQLSESGWLATPTAKPPTATPGPSLTPTLPPDARKEIANSQRQIEAIAFERDTLKKQLADTNTKLAKTSADLNKANDNLAKTTDRLTALQNANQQLASLVDLYKQLESVNIDDVIIKALGAVGVPVLAVYTLREALNAGTILAARVMKTIEDQMPLIAAGMAWLDQQLATLTKSMQTLTVALQITASTPAGKAVTDFISGVLDLIPFNAGQNIKQGLQAMGDLVAKLPEFVTNARVRVLEPARAWITTDKQGGLYALLLNPMRDQLLTPAQQMIANAQNLNTVYNNQVVQPAQSAITERARIRAEIAKRA